MSEHLADSLKEKKKPITDEERLALCQKLDQELDDFINSLEKKEYTDGWTEDNWEEEMDKHPFFMKKAPEDGQLSPLAEGLAKLKYDPDENTPLELAVSYKEDGNFNFKHKNYRLAIISYTEGIKVKCGDADVEASLYNNRAAAHWHLKNYRSCLIDSEKALALNPHHTKALVRAAKAAYEIAKYDICIQHCEKYLQVFPKDEEIVKLLDKAKREMKIQAMKKRKQERIDSVNAEKRDAILAAIAERGIRLGKCDREFEVDTTGKYDHMVQMKDGVLLWPCLFFFPEYSITDFVKLCSEYVPLSTQIEQLFPAPWDEKNKYKLETINVYYEGYDHKPHIVSPEKNLGEIIVQEYYEVTAGNCCFYILPRGTVIERNFLEKYI